VTFLIWSIEHGGWWRPGGYGYTLNVAEAGRYAFPETLTILARANFVKVNECAIPLEAVGRSPLPDRLIAVLRQEVRNGAGHDCEEWMEDGRCQLCDRENEG